MGKFFNTLILEKQKLERRMTRRIIVALLVLVFFLFNEKIGEANPTSDKIIKFSGEIRKDQKFEKEIGNDLFFVFSLMNSDGLFSLGRKKD